MWARLRAGETRGVASMSSTATLIDKPRECPAERAVVTAVLVAFSVFGWE